MKIHGSNIDIFRNLKHIKHKNFAIDDPIEILFILSHKLGRRNSSKIIRSLVLFQYSFGVIITLYKFIVESDSGFLIKYGNHFALSIYVIINLTAAFVKGPKIEKFTLKYNKTLLPLNIAGNQTFLKILSYSKRLKAAVLLNIILATLASLMFTFSWDYYINRWYLIYLLSDKPFNKVVKFGNTISNFVIGYSLIGISFSTGYSFMTATFQFMILNEFVKNIKAKSIEKEQNIIKQKLKICILIHQNILRYLNIYKTIISNVLLAFSIGGVILGAGLILGFFAEESEKLVLPLHTKLGNCFISLAGILTSLMFAVTGQTLANKSEEIYGSLLLIPWYNFNKENRILYSIFLYETKKPILIGNALMELNHILLTKLLRGLYTMFAIVNQVLDKEKVN